MLKAQKTTLVKDKDIKRQWREIDAAKFTLGRLATQVAHILSGKHKTTFAPHQDLGDYVVVINADKIKFTNPVRKGEAKTYYRYSGYAGGLRKQTLAEKLIKDPVEVIRHAVKNMLDDNRLRKQKLRRLKIVEGTEHKYPVTRNA